VEAIATVDSFQADFVDVNVVGVFVGFMAISFDEESAGFLIEGFDIFGVKFPVCDLVLQLAVTEQT